jgi:PAS domain S-box-containing protein
VLLRELMTTVLSSRYLRLGAVCAALVLGGMVAFAVHTVRSFRATSDAVLHTQEVRVQLGDLFSRMKDIHLQTRAYLQSGDERSLQARDQALAEYNRELAGVRQLMAGSPGQQQALDRLSQLLKDLLVEYDIYAELRRTKGAQALAARAADGEGKRIADEIKTVALGLQAGETKLLEQRLAAARRDGNITMGVLIGGFVLDAALIGTLLLALGRDLRAREAAARMTQQSRAYFESIVETVREPLVILTHDLRVNSANRGFYETFGLTQAETNGHLFAELHGGVWNIPELQTALARVVPQHDEIHDLEITREFSGLGAKTMLVNARKLYRIGNGTTMTLLAIEDITERKQAEGKLQRAKAALEERTQELEAANQELEAFSYSVSHDLRAPLRHIDYFSAMLQKQLPPEKLDGNGRRHLTTISDSARNMGQLIDDLLAFARIGRAPLRKVRVKPEDLVAEARRDLQREATGRNIDWQIATLPEVEGDPALLRQVFANLIGNAVKYTRHCAETRIEIGTQPAPPGEVILYVRDNGAGFDMQYADKLFGVFQRLHSNNEFEGTGVGLANVRRIVHRHGGRTWAEGKVGAGATFYFSLPVPTS